MNNLRIIMVLRKVIFDNFLRPDEIYPSGPAIAKN